MSAFLTAVSEVQTGGTCAFGDGSIAIKSELGRWRVKDWGPAPQHPEHWCEAARFCRKANGISEDPLTTPDRQPEDRAEQFIQAAIDSAPEPLRRLGEWLANKLDDDDWKTADRLITGAAVAIRNHTAFDFLAHLRRQREFSERTFGPGPRTKGVVDHIRKELAEIEAAPSDLMEWIDVAILALDGAWRTGATPEQIVETLVAKQTKNEGRTWPDWRTMSSDQAIEHDRTDDPVAGDA